VILPARLTDHFRGHEGGRGEGPCWGSTWTTWWDPWAGYSYSLYGVVVVEVVVVRGPDTCQHVRVWKHMCGGGRPDSLLWESSSAKVGGFTVGEVIDHRSFLGRAPSLGAKRAVSGAKMRRTRGRWR